MEGSATDATCACALNAAVFDEPVTTWESGATIRCPLTAAGCVVAV